MRSCFLALGYVNTLFINFIKKIIEFNKYDKKAIINEIKKEYPKSYLTFQNFVIVDNNTTYYLDRYTYRTHFIKKHIYINNGKLDTEPNYLNISFLLPFAIFGFAYLITLEKGLHTKLNELNINENMLYSVFKTVIIVSIIIISVVFISDAENKDYNRRYNSYTNITDSNINDIINKINIKHYKLD